MKKIVSLLLVLVLSGCKSDMTYGVYIGSDEVNDIDEKNIVVIDAQNFSSDEIETIHQKADTVYSYLNVGSLEEFRDYYDDFKDITLSSYDNWDGEYWIDVSNSKWQSYVIDTLAKELLDKGCDGLFLDNFDIYYEYQSDEIYEGLYTILKGLNEYNCKIIINGGYEFINKLDDYSLLYGVNQESVLLSVDYDNNTSSMKDESEYAYILDYLNKCKENNLEVFTIEYAFNNNEVIDKVEKINEENGWHLYVAEDLSLK